ncbi:head-tail connector protein [Oceanomicrobium pacificus]|uniref:Phage gp6-like head-tail connector protein n=1 Tax=Oceanomicrobium pacificus TaxID=2692916 RepID=A0A6B0TX73_9RHOB|nr:hypothetical protein [Oceanomicrobium pacificus]MXU66315.1 hypothetical protein [Oceanomicrobium pacificus]
MVLTEVTAIPDARWPVAAFADHLLMSSGFDDDDRDDALLLMLLRAAAAAVEARLGKALLARDFRVALAAWRRSDRQPLPMAPVYGGGQFVMRDAGGADLGDPGGWVLEPDTARPALVGTGGRPLPAIPAGGVAEVTFTAGFAADWTDLPADLQQAVFLLAAHYHAARDGAAGADLAMPVGVLALIDPHRVIRVLGAG